VNASDFIALLNSPVTRIFVIIFIGVAVVLVVVALAQGRTIEFYGLKIGASPQATKPELPEQATAEKPVPAPLPSRATPVRTAPALPSESPPPASRKPRSQIQELSRNRALLLVEDEPDILIIFHRLLRGWMELYNIPDDVVTVNSGYDALAYIALRPIPLVITDYNMPGMNGLQLAQAIKETSPDTTIVMITAYATPQLEAKAYKAGVDHFFPKPFPLDQLERIVRGVFE
jgi:two-component system, response regulator, stage 0 sporulation protein F